MLGALAAGAALAAPDTPELAAPGPFAIGVGSLTLVRDRVILVDVWYPARSRRGAARAVYSAALTGEDGRDVAFAFAGEAVRGAPPRSGSFPLVILAHGYGGTPVAMSWLAENLASKGYVVVGPHFRDPPITDVKGFAGPLARRPLDIAFVAAEAQARARARQGLLAAVDPSRTVLIGYSMGGYGVLTDAGAPLDPALAAATHGALGPYVSGGARTGALKVANLVAVVAISPAGVFAGVPAWGAQGLAAVAAPTLFIVGSRDSLVGYDPGVKTLFGLEAHAPRYLLTFENAGHSIGMNAAPAAMRTRLWNQDWFEDPVWRKDRVLGVELHFITAFLARYAKGETAAAAFLKVPTPVGAEGQWALGPGEPYGAASPGAPAMLWKGFQRRTAVGLEFSYLPAAH